MDPHRLRLLRELGDRGSVAAVAAALNVTASAVSQQLSALQAGFPIPLTEKDGRRLILTEAGEALAVASARVDTALADARDAVESFLAAPEKTVKVAAFHSAGLALFAPLLHALGESARVRLSDEDVPQERFTALTADHDLVIAHRLAHDPDWPRNRHAVVPLFSEPLDIALHSSHPLAGQSTVRPEDLRDARWVSTHDGFPLAGVLHHIAAVNGRPPRIDHRINEFFVAAQVVRTGAAIAVIPRVTGAPLAVDGMVLRPLEGEPVVRHVDVLARPEALAHASVRTVLTALEKVSQELSSSAR